MTSPPPPAGFDCEVLVVGAGPGGTAAAICLARAGRDVVVIDKAAFPRDKCCGDGLTTGALRMLDALGLAPGDVASWSEVTQARVVSPSGRVADLSLQQDGPGGGIFCAVARRIDLDAALVDLARDAGATVLDGHGLTAMTVPMGSECVAAEVEGVGTVRARYVIAADGMWSPTRKLLLSTPDGGTLGDPIGYLGEWHGMRQYFSDVGPLAASQLWVWFEPDLLPGYMWSFPLLDGRANVGYGLLRGSDRANAGGAITAHDASSTLVPRIRSASGRQPLGKHMKALWPQLLERPHIREVLGANATPEEPVKAWPIPARIGEATLTTAGGRVLFVGDAARATDPLTGEGIGQALETGMLAAESIIAAGALSPYRAAQRYEGELRRGMALDHALAGFLARAMSHRRGARAAVRIAGSTPWVRRNFARWLFEDYPRAVVATPHRWRRGVMTGSGAFRREGSGR